MPGPRTQRSRGVERMMEFSLWEALLGRRSRRFFRGATIPDGPFQYTSRHPPMPLDDVETMLLVAACAGNTSWNHLIFRAARYAPHLSNYAGAAGGRTFPSAAGFHTSQIFFTDDRGVFLVDNRDAPASARRDADGRITLGSVTTAIHDQVRPVEDGRLRLPPEVPFVEAHNTWVVNHPGALLVIPVGDLAQHVLLGLMYMLQNGYVLVDDVHGRAIPGIEAFSDLHDEGKVWPLTFAEQLMMSELTAELSTSCYAGALALQAMGLGGWMFDGIDPLSMLGASGDPRAPGLGFRYDVDDRWPTPNVTGRAGVMEAFTPPTFSTMRAAVDVLCERKFGVGGPYHADTPGPFRETARIRGAAVPHDERFRACVAHQAQYVYDTFGKFPAVVPSMLVVTYLQACHLDLEFYDRFFEPGAYLETHAAHLAGWHG